MSSQASKAQQLPTAATAKGENEAVKGAHQLDRFINTPQHDGPYYFPGEQVPKRVQEPLPELDRYFTKLAGEKKPKL